MENKHDKSKTFFAGLLVGGLIGAAALYFGNTCHPRKTPIVKKIGKTISGIGEMLENSEFDCNEIVDSIEKRLPKGSDMMSTAADWLDTGMKLWKQFK